MAGSYSHVSKGWSLIENMGDAAEVVEEMLFVMRLWLSEEQIEIGVSKFRACERGDEDAEIPFIDLDRHRRVEVGEMYREVKRTMLK